MTYSSLTVKLLNWYAQNARDLPWRGRRDPYAIWVSEIMLQQTRVETVIPYFERWMERFPTINSLAEASQQDVLAAWEGLGYYSRARNLHAAAKIVVEQHGAQLPADVKELRELPGIGRYTAGAIASIAFGLDEPALDGNIRRVLARVFDLSEPARSPKGERKLWHYATENLPAGQAGDYNQSLMDLGAMICTPRDPTCAQCPLASDCQAFALGIQEERPVVEKKAITPHYTVTAAIIQRHDQVLIAQRPANGLLGGLWEFPGGKVQPEENLASCLQREICEELGVQIQIGSPLGVYHHAYTHFRVTLHAFLCKLVNSNEPKPLEASSLHWARLEELANFPMGKIDRQISRDLIQKLNS